MIARPFPAPFRRAFAPDCLRSRHRPEAGAQQFPATTIRIVAGAAGNPGDITSRIIANELAQSEGWRVIVENRPGAMQTIAAAEVLKQPPDGHTIFLAALPTTVAPALWPT